MAEAPDRDPDDVVTVTQDGITVEKRFTTDEFPVPAVKFDLQSEADGPVDVRLTDDVPESFEMERIGFHPEYGGDNWTAYRDHRVEYERTVDPGEEVTTVYGVRIQNPEDGVRFLGEPRLERVSGGEPDADPEEILGRETTGAVRDALAGEGELAADADAAEGPEIELDEPGDVEAADDESGTVSIDAAGAADSAGDLDLDAGDGGSEDLTLDAGDEDAGGLDLDGPGTDDSEEDLNLDLDDPGTEDPESEDPESEDLDIDLDDPAADEGESEDADLDLDVGDDAESEDLDLDVGDDAESEDLDLDVGESEAPAPRSIDADLPSAVEASEGDAAGTGAPGGAAARDDTAGGADAPAALPGNVAAALAAEIRDGTADEDNLDALREALGGGEAGVPRSVEVRIDRLQNRTEDLAAYTDALEAFIDEEGTAREMFDEFDDRLEDVEATVDDLDAHAESLDESLDDLDSRIEDLESDLDDLAGDAESSVADLRETIEDVEATMADVEDEIEDLQSFRDRMRDAFGS